MATPYKCEQKAFRLKRNCVGLVLTYKDQGRILADVAHLLTYMMVRTRSRDLDDAVVFAVKLVNIGLLERNVRIGMASY